MKNLQSGLMQPKKLKNIFISVHDGAVTYLIVKINNEKKKNIKEMFCEKNLPTLRFASKLLLK